MDAAGFYAQLQEYYGVRAQSSAFEAMMIRTSPIEGEVLSSFFA